MPKAYRLSIEVVGDHEGYTPQAWSKGHHEPCRFLRRAVRAVRREIDDDEALMVLKRGHERVLHEWWRTDLRATKDTGDIVYESVPGPGPGVFPATVLWLAG